MAAVERVERRFELRIGARDRVIIERARDRLAGVGRVDFGDAMRALREAVEESIPGGRVYVLGQHQRAPIAGSLVTGVGIVEVAGGVELVRTGPDGGLAWLGRFAP